MVISHGARKIVQPYGAGIVAKTLPSANDIGSRCVRERSEIGKARHEAFERGDHALDLRLLQHELADDYAIGRRLAAPRQMGAPVSRVPKKQSPRHGAAFGGGTKVPAGSRERRSVARFIDVDAAPRSFDATRPIVWLCALLLLAGASYFALQQSDRDLGRLLANSDFTAYYCAGSVARLQGDPYQAAPMEQCAAGASNPAPLPGYATALFSVASFAQPQIAGLGWMLFLCAALVLTVWALHAASGVSPIAIAAALVGTDLIAGASFGQISVVTVLGISLCALGLSRGRHVGAALAALLTLMQPQIGVPIVLSLFLWAPRTRLVLFVGVAALVALSYLHLGAKENAEYVQRALPAFGASEVPLHFQYGFAWILYFFGESEGRALVASAIQYGATVLLAIAFAPMIARRLDAPAALATFPAVAAVLGGPNLHLAELAAAIPFAVVLTGTTARTRGLAWFALVLLAVPWIAIELMGQAAASAVVAGVVALFALPGRPWFGRAVVALAAVALVIATPLAISDIPDRTLHVPPNAGAFWGERFGDDLAAVQHGLAIRSQAVLTTPTLQNFVRKTPDWAGVALVFLAGLLSRPAGRSGEPEDFDDPEVL